VLVADDQAMVREGLVVLLDAQPDLRVVGEAADGSEAVRLAAQLRPDVVLMDVRMPVLDGLEATRRIVGGAAGRETTFVRVLVLTTFDEDEYVYGALRAGASGFVLKTSSAQALSDAVRIVAGGDALLAPSATARLLADFTRLGSPQAPDRDRLARLTGREAEILALLARGLSNAEIAGRLVLAEHTVKTHVSRVLTKLGLRDRTQAVIFAYETGIVRPGE
jgi:DNA-binding NarL/FixJ family response regulator